MSKRSRVTKQQRRDLKKKKQKRAEAERRSPAVPSGRLSSFRSLNRPTRSRLAEAARLTESGDLSAAEAILVDEEARHSGHPDILEDLLRLYQIQDNHHSAALIAERLLRIRPMDAEIRLSLAQGYLFEGRVPMARKAYRDFLDVSPNHEYATKAEAALKLIEPEVARILKKLDLSEDEFDLLLLHDEIVFDLSANRMDSVIAKARKLLAIKPNLVSARNNLALGLFQTGKLADAVLHCRETVELFPDNRFAEASLGRYLMLNGDSDEANTIADRIVECPASQQDAISQQVEFMSMLGRDDDVLKLVAHGDDIVEKDDGCCAMLCHHRAVALARLGKQPEAEESWDTALKHDPHFSTARENLDDLESVEAGNHAPWSLPLVSWVSKRAVDSFSAKVKKLAAEGNESPISQALSEFPNIQRLVPALLDRGDPRGREFAFGLVKAVKSPELLDALHDFAFSQRGPDTLRNEALLVLRINNRLESGSHRIFMRGKWKDVDFFSPEITDEPTPVKTPELQELHEEGYFALSDGEAERAEAIFRKCIEIDPDDPSSWHNLAGALLQHGDEESMPEVRKILNDLHQRFPDYLFARTSLAQLALQDGDLQAARDLIAPIRKRQQMHRSEVIAYFSIVGQMDLVSEEIESAETTALLMEEIDPDHPSTISLRRRLAFARMSASLSSEFESIMGSIRGEDSSE